MTITYSQMNRTGKYSEIRGIDWSVSQNGEDFVYKLVGSNALQSLTLQISLLISAMSFPELVQ